MNLLILGGTTEASELARALAGDARVRATMSLAGRTQHPIKQPLPTRVGGFGGVEGLTAYLIERRIDMLVDATHPFAARITANAVAAARRAGTSLIVLLRPEWTPTVGDRWIQVDDMAEAATALGPDPRRVLLTVGQKDLLPFRTAPNHHYVLRSVDPPPADMVPPHAEFIAARGPFVEAEEQRLLIERGIEVIVTKNSGGGATEAKLVAARNIGLPVVMVRRPPAPKVPTMEGVADILKCLHAALPRGE